jgi:hypothetical protein
VKILLTIAIAAGLASPALAQELTQEQKDDALRTAYRINGGVMSGPLVDLTDPRTLALAKPVRTVPVPVDPPAVKVAEVRSRPAKRADICQRHGKRKVATHGGRSWRCR